MGRPRKDVKVFDDVINWFENGQLMIGNRNEPDHVNRRDRWDDTVVWSDDTQQSAQQIVGAELQSQQLPQGTH